MPNQTSKSHKSRKTEDEAQGKPRQRAIDPAEDVMSSVTDLSPVESPSSLVLATTASGEAPDSSEASQESGGARWKALFKSESKEGSTEEKAFPTAKPSEGPPEEQSWYRKPSSPLKKQSEKIAVMRLAGHNSTEIAKRMKTTPKNVRYVEWVARKNGWYDAEGEFVEPVDVEAELAFNIDKKVVRNISASLDGQMTNWQTHEMTLAAAKGRGMFKTHDGKSDGQTGQLPIVAIQVVMPPLGAGDQLAKEENIAGVAAYIEGDVSGGS